MTSGTSTALPVPASPGTTTARPATFLSLTTIVPTRHFTANSIAGS